MMLWSESEFTEFENVRTLILRIDEIRLIKNQGHQVNLENLGSDCCLISLNLVKKGAEHVFRYKSYL